MSSIRRLAGRDDEYGDGSTAFEVTKPVDLARLEEEIKAAHHWRTRSPGLVSEGDPAAASDTDPVVVWVTQAEADVRTVKRVVAAHEGVQEDTDDDLAVLRAKAQAGEEFTDDEVQTALRLLLTRG